MSDRMTFEQINKRKYEGETYSPESITELPKQNDPRDYSGRMLQLKFELIRQYCGGRRLLDVCCGNGLHLLNFADNRDLAVGVDFSRPFIEHANKLKRDANFSNVEFLHCDAKAMPLADNSFDAAYSLAALYHIPSVESAISEISRVLRLGGQCVLDMGNLYSLNTIACRAYSEVAQGCHVPYSNIRRMILNSGFDIVEHRCFQLLPMWARKPIWLWPLLHPVWERVLCWRMGDRMLDERISSLPIIRRMAFRHILVCAKQGGGTSA